MSGYVGVRDGGHLHKARCNYFFTTLHYVRAFITIIQQTLQSRFRFVVIVAVTGVGM